MQQKSGLITFLLLVLFQSLYSGEIEVVSDPLGAEIILNRIRTGRYTPDTLQNLPNNSELSVSVMLDEYPFTERFVVPLPDTLIQLSFSQLTGFDTLSITSDSIFGILQLPMPPVEAPYLVNEIIEDRETVILTAGFHRIEWDGGITYEPIDTTIEVLPAKITTLDLHFDYRYGRITLRSIPDNAAIYVDSTLWGIGSVLKPFPAGSHTVSVQADGYIVFEKQLTLFPGQQYRDTLRLVPLPDRDGDGFDDTLDHCPEVFGTYDGCPEIQKQIELRRIGLHLGETFRSAPATFEFSPISMKKRFATNSFFEESMSVFNDGSSFLNNYNGISVLNKLWFSKGLFIASMEYDYSLAPLKYEKEWILPTNQDSTEYLEYDSFSNVTPEARFLTLSPQIGVQFAGNNVIFAFLTGYQYEEIEISGVTKEDSTGNTFYIGEYAENSSWITTVRSTIPLRSIPFFPRVYVELSFAPYGSVTGWIDTKLGVTIPIWRDHSTLSESEN